MENQRKYIFGNYKRSQTKNILTSQNLHLNVLQIKPHKLEVNVIVQSTLELV